MIKHTRSLFSIAFFLVFSITAMAQLGTIRGFVYEDETGEPAFATVSLEGTSHGAPTNMDGFFTITSVPPGEYTVVVSAVGMNKIRKQITLKGGQILNQKFFVTTGVELEEIQILGETEKKRNEVTMSMTQVTPKDINKIPTVGGEADIAQYMQVIPGVVFTGDQGGQLYIRGGSPVQNKVLLDGMIIYNPFHSIGLFSVFDTDIIRNADIYTGGFNAEYGGRISSVMDINTRDGNKRNLAGRVGASTFGGKILVEGPLKKAKVKGGSTSSFVFSGKRSYLDQTSKTLYSYVNDGNGLPFNYTDLYGKVSFNGSNGSKFNVFGFNFDDQVNYQLISDLNWNARGMGSNFVLVPGNSPVLIQGNFAYSTYDITLEEANANTRSSAVNGFNGGLDFTYFIKDDEIKYGVEMLGFATDFEFYNDFGRKIEQRQNTTEFAGFFRYKIKRGNWVIDPSFRVHYYASLNTPSPEPRLGVKYNVNDRFRAKLAAGVYSQNLISASSDRDVVNLFYGFLSGPDNLQDNFTDENGNVKEVKHKLQKANHLIIGGEYDLSETFSLNVEGYLKRFTQLTNINRNKLFDDNLFNFDRPDVLKKDFIIETGNAYGVDMVLKYDNKRTYLWFVYSIGKVDRWDGIQTYAPVFDRRHNVNFVWSYAFGKKRNFEFNGRWNFGSGFPFTLTQGFYERYTFSDGIDTDYTSEGGELGILYDDINKGRLPTYHRMDMNIKWTATVSDRSTLEVNAGITNVYNRENIFYFDRVKYDRVNQLPVLPSAGVVWIF